MGGRTLSSDAASLHRPGLLPRNPTVRKRPKNPELIRNQCLSVVRDLLVSHGPEFGQAAELVGQLGIRVG